MEVAGAAVEDLPDEAIVAVDGLADGLDIVGVPAEAGEESAEVAGDHVVLDAEEPAGIEGLRTEVVEDTRARAVAGVDDGVGKAALERGSLDPGTVAGADTPDLGIVAGRHILEQVNVADAVVGVDQATAAVDMDKDGAVGRSASPVAYPGAPGSDV